MKYLAKVYVSLKESVLDPQGKTVKNSIDNLGYTDIENVRIGKYIELTIESENRDKAIQEVEEVSQNVLINPVIEKYEYDLLEVE